MEQAQIKLESDIKSNGREQFSLETSSYVDGPVIEMVILFAI